MRNEVLGYQSFVGDCPRVVPLDERGFIRGNHFLVCGEIADAGQPGYREHKLGEVTDYVGPAGAPLFRLHLLPDGHGLVLECPGTDARYRVHSDAPTTGVSLAVSRAPGSAWCDLGTYSVSDDTEAGRYEIRHSHKGNTTAECFSYHRDTGRLVPGR